MIMSILNVRSEKLYYCARPIGSLKTKKLQEWPSLKRIIRKYAIPWLSLQEKAERQETRNFLQKNKHNHSYVLKKYEKVGPFGQH